MAGRASSTAFSLSILLLFICTISNALDNSFTIPLYGEKLKGFMKVDNVKDEQYVLSFQADSAPADTRVSLHQGAVPYDSAVLTDNCRRARKSPHIFRDRAMKEITVSGSDLIGHTIILGNDEEIYACTTVIVGSLPLLYAFFHAEPIQGPIHIIPMKNKVRLLPDLKYPPHFDGALGVDIIDWAFVETCNSQNSNQNSAGTELGVDSRATLTIETSGVNVTLKHFELFRNGKPFACEPIQAVEARTVRAGDYVLSQPHYFVPVKSHGGRAEELRIREDCLDLATETIHPRFHDHFPSLSIFGPDTVLLKSMVDGDSCSVLRPQFPLRSATATLQHPIVGRIVFVDTDDRIILTGNLRHLFEDEAARATVQISPKYAASAGCPLYLEDCTECFTVPDAAVVVGRNESEVSLIGVLPYFDIEQMRSVVVDLQWTKEPFHVCANLSHLPDGAIQASALIKRFSPVAAKTVASVVVLEYPANNYSEIILKKEGPLDGFAVHSRPIDMAQTAGPPCGEQTIGPKIAPPSWFGQLDNAIKHGDKTTSLVVSDQLISGSNNLLGTSLLFSNDKEVYCGSFDVPDSRQILAAKFAAPIEGYLILSQYSSTAGLPTEVNYNLHRANSSLDWTKESFLWEVVNDQNLTCNSAVLYNPFQADEILCSPSTKSMCPIGSAAEKSSPLQCGGRRHITVPSLPLSGTFSVAGKSIRLKSLDGNESIACAPLISYNEASFRWSVLSNRSLSELQSELAGRFHIDTFQVAIDYNRQLLGGRCSLFRVTVFETNDRLAEILKEFDVEKYKFVGDEALECVQETTTDGTTGNTTTPTKAAETHSVLSTIAISLLISAIASLMDF